MLEENWLFIVMCLRVSYNYIMSEFEEDPLERIPANEDTGDCGYFDEREETCILTSSYWINEHLDKEFSHEYIFGNLIQKGFRRSGQYFYLQICEHCDECTPIRINTKEFIISKSQKNAWKKNQDIEVTVCTDSALFSTDEKAFLFREYDNYHNGHKSDYKKLSIEEAKETLALMYGGYKGAVNMEYRLNGKLIGVGLLDVTEDSNGVKNALSSNYFYYDVSDEVLKRSIGVFSVLKEIEYCLKNNITYYYLGLYLPNCRKMNYKINYKPFELLKDGEWVKYDNDPFTCS